MLMEANRERRMKALSAKDAKYDFGRMIDLARAEPVAVRIQGENMANGRPKKNADNNGNGNGANLGFEAKLSARTETRARRA
jgi:hypothetical protein